MFHLRKRGKLSSFHTDVLAFPTTRRETLWNVERPDPFSRPLCVGISLFQPTGKPKLGLAALYQPMVARDATPHRIRRDAGQTIIRTRAHVQLNMPTKCDIHLPNLHRSSWLLLNIKLPSRTRTTTDYKSAITLGISRPTITTPLVSRCFIRHVE